MDTERFCNILQYQRAHLRCTEIKISLLPFNNRLGHSTDRRMPFVEIGQQPLCTLQLLFHSLELGTAGMVTDQPLVVLIDHQSWQRVCIQSDRPVPLPMFYQHIWNKIPRRNRPDTVSRMRIKQINQVNSLF